MKKLIGSVLAIFVSFPALVKAIDNNPIPFPIPPTVISTVGQNASNPKVAVDLNGHLVAVWIENSDVQSTSGTVIGGWSGTITTISASGTASSPLVQIDQTGTAVAVWVDAGTIQLSSRPLAGSWSAPTTLSASTASSPALAIDSSGNEVAVWVESGIVKSALRTSGGGVTTPVTVSSGGSASSPQVYIGDNGTVVAVWQGVNGSTPAIFASTSSVSSFTWSLQQILSTALVNSVFPQVVVDTAGNATAIWFTYSIASLAYNNVVVQSSQLPFAGSWSSPVTISTAGEINPANLFSSLSLSYSNNQVFAIWSNSNDSSNYTIQWNLLINGVWSTPSTVVQQNTFSNEVIARVNAVGAAVAAWPYYDVVTNTLVLEVGGDPIVLPNPMFAIIILLSNGGQNSQPFIAVNPTGSHAYQSVVWTSFNGTNNVIEAIAYPSLIIQPPQTPSVSANTQSYGIYTDLYNLLSWTASPSPGVFNYLIVRNGLGIAVIPSSTLQYQDHNRTVGDMQNYEIYAMDIQGRVSQPANLSITN